MKFILIYLASDYLLSHWSIMVNAIALPLLFLLSYWRIMKYSCNDFGERIKQDSRQNAKLVPQIVALAKNGVVKQIVLYWLIVPLAGLNLATGTLWWLVANGS